MPIGRKDAERGLELLWEFRNKTDDPIQRSAYEQAIASLHAFLTDVLPASQPCVRAKVKDGFVELHPTQEAPVQVVELKCIEGEKIGLCLDRVNGWGVDEVSSIVIGLVKRGSVAARDSTLKRGDQVLEVNGHSLAQVSLDRARWLMDSAERSKRVCLAIIPSGLIEGLKHSVSRMDLLEEAETSPVHRSRSMEQLLEATKPLPNGRLESTAQPSNFAQGQRSDHATKTKGSARLSRSSLHDHPLYAPSIGSRRESNQSLVSSTVETAAHIARSSMRSFSSHRGGAFKKRKVRKMHIMKGASGLGLRIVGGKGSKYGDMGVFVRDLEEGGAAHKDGRLKPGDELLMVDGKSLVGLSHSEAVAVLKSTQQLVQLVVATEMVDDQSVASSLQSIPDKLVAQGGRFGISKQLWVPTSPLSMVSPPTLDHPSHMLQESEMKMDVVSPEMPSLQRKTFEEKKEEVKEEGGRQDQVKKWGKLDNLAILEEQLSPTEMLPLVEITPTATDDNTMTTETDFGGLSTQLRNASNQAEPGGSYNPSSSLRSTETRLLMKSGPSEGPLIKESNNIEVVGMVTQWGRLSSSNIRPVPPEPKVKSIVYVKSEGKSLGFTICGGKGSKCGDIGIYVRSIQPGGIAAKDGRLREGDELLEVNGKSLAGCTHKKAASIIKGLKTEIVTLQVCSGPGKLVLPIKRSPSVKGTTVEVTLYKESGQELGMELEGVQSDSQDQCAVFIRNIVPGSPAHLSGALHRCDQLIEVNGESLLNQRVEEVQAVLSSLPSGEVRVRVVRPRDVDTVESVLQNQEKQQMISPTSFRTTTSETYSTTTGMGERGATPTFQEDHVHRKLVIADLFSPPSESESQEKSTDTEMEEEMEAVTPTSGPPQFVPPASIEMEEQPPPPTSAPPQLMKDLTPQESNEENEEDYYSEPTPPISRPESSPTVPFTVPKLTTSRESISESTDEESDSGKFVVRQVVNTKKDDSEIKISGSILEPNIPATMKVKVTETSNIQDDLQLTPPLPTSLPPSEAPPKAETVKVAGYFSASEDMRKPLPVIDVECNSDLPFGFVQLEFQIKKRARSGLGITIVSCRGSSRGLFMIRRIMAGGAAAKDGRLKPGDRLVSVGERNLADLSHATVLQALNDAPRDCQLVVWRDPNYDLDATSSIYSLGDRSNLSGSRSSILSDDDNGTEESIPKRLSTSSLDPYAIFKSRTSSVSDGSPLTARFSTSALEQHNLRVPSSPGFSKRWSTGVLSPNGPAGEPLHQIPSIRTPTPTMPPLTPLPSPTTPPTMSPLVPLSSPRTPSISPDFTLPEGSEDIGLPQPPQSPPPPIPTSYIEEEHLNTPGLEHKHVQEATETWDGTAKPEDLSTLHLRLKHVQEATEVWEEPSELRENEREEEAPPPLPPTTPPPSVPSPDETIMRVEEKVVPRRKNASKEDPFEKTVERPKSLGPVPKGKRLEDAPFEIEVTKGMFSLGLTVCMTEMGMIAVKSLTSRSPISKDGNIKVGDLLLSINDVTLISETAARVENIIKTLPRGPVRFVAMAPPRNVTGVGFKPDKEELTMLPPAIQPPSSPLSLPPPQPTPSEEQIMEDEGVVSVQLHRFGALNLGIMIEGGSDTNLQYVFIKSLVPGSPAFNCAQLKSGDQLVMVGKDCLIGMTQQGAKRAIEQAPESVEIVVQRKKSQKQSPKSSAVDIHISEPSTPDQRQSPQPLPRSESYMKSRTLSYSGEVHVPMIGLASIHDQSFTKSMSLSTSWNMGLSVDSLRLGSHEEIRELPEVKKTVPEETLTVDLCRSGQQKLGLAIVGGVDNPRLPDVHVKQVIKDSAAFQDGRIKRGDRIVSVNGRSLSGLTNKEALLLIKNTGDNVTLELVRKIGRRSSAVPTPMTSTLQSRRSSGDQSKESSLPPSPPKVRRQRRPSSGECSKEGSKAPSPPTFKRLRRESTKDIGTGTRTKTLPRKLNSTVGVKVVDLHKGPTGLGMQLLGGANMPNPVTVKEVFLGGPAHKSGKIHAGDIILEANGISFEGLNHNEAIKTMKEFPQGKITLLLRDRTATLGRTNPF